MEAIGTLFSCAPEFTAGVNLRGFPVRLPIMFKRPLNGGSSPQSGELPIRSEATADFKYPRSDLRDPNTRFWMSPVLLGPPKVRKPLNA